MLGIGILVAIPFALCCVLPIVWAARMTALLAVLMAGGAGWVMWSVFGDLFSAVVAAVFFYVVGTCFGWLFILFRLQQRGLVPQDTIRLI